MLWLIASRHDDDDDDDWYILWCILATNTIKLNHFIHNNSQNGAKMAAVARPGLIYTDFMLYRYCRAENDTAII